MTMARTTGIAVFAVALLTLAVSLASVTIATLPPLPRVAGVSDADVKAARSQYHLAIRRPALFEKLGCPCGCITLGHANLRDCFVLPSTGWFKSQTQWNAHALT